jgi:hypothetical protein
LGRCLQMRVCVSSVRGLVVISFPPCERVWKGWITKGLHRNENRPGRARPVLTQTPVCVFVAGCAGRPPFYHLSNGVNA